MITRQMIPATLLCLLASTAFAQGTTAHQWYVGADIGQSETERDGDPDSSISDFDDKSSAWSLRGGYRFSRYFALEAGYVDFGEFGDDVGAGCVECNPLDFESASHGVLLNALVIWPVAKRLRLEFLAGGVFLEKEARIGGVSSDASGFVPKIGFGVAVPVTDHFAVNLEWTGYFDWDLGLMVDEDIELFTEGTTELLTLGVRWSF